MSGGFERIAVTGVGVVSALGADSATTFAALLSGTRGFSPVTLFEVADQRCTIGAQVHGLRVSDVAPAAEARLWSRTDAMALVAAREALSSARVSGPRGPLGVSVGGTTGGMFETEEEILGGPHAELASARADRLMSFPLSMTSERLSQVLGPALRTSTVCSACSSGAIALVQAMAWLRRGEVERVVAGGADGLCRLTFVGFNSLGATDKEPCKPFDRRRAGLSLGEGAAFLVLENESVARRRGAEILAFLSGSAVLAEAHHITHPEPSGRRAAELMRRALSAAALAPSDVDYVNAHGTGTVQNDAMEAAALSEVFGVGRRPLVSSAKGQVGHTLGAAGAIEAAITVLSLQSGRVAATAGLQEPELSALGHVLGSSVLAEPRVALSNSFGFGGMGCVLAFEHAGNPARPASAAPRTFVVTGACAIGPLGLSENDAVARYLEPCAPGDVALSVPFDPLTVLDADRSRRFDRGAALVAHGAVRAAAAAGRPAAGTGLIVGSAYGNVERSIRFLLRVAERGPKLASPAEFPHLVASAGAGNASVYAGFDGPVLTVSEREQSGEAAISRALSLLELELTGGIVAGAAEARDAIIERVLGASRRSGAVLPRSEGAAFVTIEEQAAARARGVAPLALIVVHVQLEVLGELDAALLAHPPRARRERGAVVHGALGDDGERALRASAWGDRRLLSPLPRSGFHEAAGAIAIAAAVGLVGSGQVDEALVLSGTNGRGHLTLLAAPPGARS